MTLIKLSQDLLLNFKKESTIEYSDTSGNIEKIDFNLIPLVTSTICKVKVPQEILNNLDVYLDNAMSNPDHPSYASRLVGQIKRGKQLLIYPEHRLIHSFSIFLKRICDLYIENHYKGMTKLNIETIIDELWSVHQYSTDYNPIHHHNNEISDYGLSFFLHLKLPEGVANATTDFDANGASDGLTKLIWGPGYVNDARLMLYPTSMNTLKETGYIYIFPQWLEHTVYPFFGEGERRTVAGNVALKYHKIIN